MWPDMDVLNHQKILLIVFVLILILLWFSKIGKSNIQCSPGSSFYLSPEMLSVAGRRCRKEIIMRWVRRMQDNFYLIPSYWPTRALCCRNVGDVSLSCSWGSLRNCSLYVLQSFFLFVDALTLSVILKEYSLK